MDKTMLDWLSGRTGKGRSPEKGYDLRSEESQGGLVAGTLVATSRGWTPVEEVWVGDEVVTFDDGVQVVTGVTRRLYPMQPANAASLAPLLSLPAEMIGNRRAMLVPRGQALVIESDLAETMLGDPFALLDAAELSGLDGIRNVLPEAPVVVVTLSFEEDQMIFVEGNSLALCPSSKVMMPATIDEAIWAEDSTRYHVLPRETAEMVVAGMVLQGAIPKEPDRSVPRPHLV